MDRNAYASKVVRWSNFGEYRRFVRETARDIRWRYGFERPPYDPYVIAERMGVTVREEPLQGVDGYIQPKGPGWEAVLSLDPTPERRRFTLAHELGHFVLLKAADRGYARDLMRFRVVGFHPEVHEDPMEEALCNAFASELLIPAEDIRKRLGWGLKLPSDIPQLASEFQTSLHAAATAVVNFLGAKRTSISLWRENSLWPLPLWWVGLRTRLRAERAKLESLVGEVTWKRDGASCRWDSFNMKKRPVNITVSPISLKFALLYVVRSSKIRPGPLTAD